MNPITRWHASWRGWRCRRRSSSSFTSQSLRCIQFYQTNIIRSSWTYISYSSWILNIVILNPALIKNKKISSFVHLKDTQTFLNYYDRIARSCTLFLSTNFTPSINHTHARDNREEYDEKRIDRIERKKEREREKYMRDAGAKIESTEMHKRMVSSSIRRNLEESQRQRKCEDDAKRSEKRGLVRERGREGQRDG